MVNEEGKILFTKLLNEFKIPKVHFDIDSNCPKDCNQEENCEMIRVAYTLAHKIVDELRSRDPLLALLAKPILVGSLKENSRVFYLGKSMYM